MSQPSWSSDGTQIAVGADHRVPWSARIVIVGAIVIADALVIYWATVLFGSHDLAACGLSDTCRLVPKQQIANTWVGIRALVAVSWIPPVIAWRRHEAVRFVALTQAVISLVLLLNASRVLASEHRDLQHCRRHHTCLGFAARD